MGVGIVAFAFVSAAATLAYAWKSSASLMPFLYSNARIQAKSRFLIPETDWISLAESTSLDDIVVNLKETDYYRYLEKARNLREFHLGIEKSFVETVEELKEMTPKSIDPLFNAYLMFWEAKMLKTIYRSKQDGQELDPDLVFPVGSVDESLLKHLQEAETRADLKVVMEGTFYGKQFKEDYLSSEEFEAAIDNKVFKEFVRRTEKTKTYDGKQILGLFNLKFDIQNLLVLLKLESRGIPEEKRSSYLIQNNTPLFKKTGKIIQAKDLREFVELCSGTPYKKTLERALEEYEKDGSLLHFERLLNKYYKETVVSMERYNIQGPYPLFSYLVKKEVEMKNLMIISKGVESKMPQEKIKELII